MPPQTCAASVHLPAQRGVRLRPRRLRRAVQPPDVLRPPGAAGGAGGADPHRDPGARGRLALQRRPAGHERLGDRGAFVVHADSAFSLCMFCETLSLSSVFQPAGPENLFVNYLSRIHREEVS